jgi:transcriptional regulator with XRE-family HTH domain
VTRGKANPLYTKFPQRLRKARKAAGMSGAGLSVTAGVAQNAASAMESSVRLPRVGTLEKLADALRVSPGWLAYGLEGGWEAPRGAPRCEGIGARLQAARAERGISLREVARRAGAGEGVAVAVARGTMPAIDTLEALAGALGVSAAWLAFGEGPRELPRRRSRLSEQHLTL